MASYTASYYNPRTGQRRQAPVGFSWTTLFFGGFVPLLRGDVLWFFIMWLLAVVTAGLTWLVFPFIYNDRYATKLVNDGFELEDGSTSINASSLSTTN